jgi:hypothetical protein
MLSSEWRSSQRSPCCHCKMNNRPSRCRTTVKQCQQCKTLVARDPAASCIILDIFKFQWKSQTNSLPSWLYDEENVMNGTIVGTTDSENTSRDSTIVSDVSSQ